MTGKNSDQFHDSPGQKGIDDDGNDSGIFLMIDAGKEADKAAAEILTDHQAEDVIII